MKLAFHCLGDRMNAFFKALLPLACFVSFLISESAPSLGQTTTPKDTFEKPFRVEMDGQPIVVGHKQLAHAGPCVADVDCDGVNDLLVGSFSGNFWLYKNVGSNSAPVFKTKSKLQAGDQDAKVGIY